MHQLQQTSSRRNLLGHCLSIIFVASEYAGNLFEGGINFLIILNISVAAAIDILCLLCNVVRICNAALTDTSDPSQIGELSSASKSS